MNMNFKNIDDGAMIEKEFVVPTYDIDMKFTTTMPVICNYLYDIGMVHAAIITKDLGSLPENIVFVMSRLHVRVEKYPLFKESALIRTWLSPIESKHVVRNYLLMDKSGEIFGRAINSATTFNLKERTGVDISGGIAASNIKTLTLEHALPHVFEAIPDADSPIYENEVDVRYFDCDFYHHVNNVRYIEWCIEAMPIEFLRKHRLYEIDISFKRESGMGEKLKVKVAAGSEENTFIHSITSEDGSRDIVRMKSVWI